MSKHPLAYLYVQYGRCQQAQMPPFPFFYPFNDPPVYSVLCLISLSAEPPPGLYRTLIIWEIDVQRLDMTASPTTVHSQLYGDPVMRRS